MTRYMQRLLLAAPAILLTLGNGAAIAGSVHDEKGVLACVNDKWDEKVLEKDHKLVAYAGRCVKVPDDAAAAKWTEDCAGQYEYLPDGSWKASGTCAAKSKDGDTLNVTWEEGSGLKENPYKVTSGTGKFKGASGGGTYKYDQLTDTLFGGRYHSTFKLP